MDDYNAFDFLSRTLKIMNYFTAKQSFIRAHRANPKVNFRYVIGPETNPSFKLVPIVSIKADCLWIYVAILKERS